MIRFSWANHFFPTDIVKNHDAIAVEDLHIRGMVTNRRLSRSISDASWGTTFRYLEYKSQWAGKEFVKIDRNYPSSQLYFLRGAQQKIPLGVRPYICKAWGHVMDRDP